MAEKKTENQFVKGFFRFHSVGQGLFYSGIIRPEDPNPNNSFCFVYDCGSLSNKRFLKNEIDDLVALLPTIKEDNSKKEKRKLNLLVVSHLHEDHVNGLAHLLQNVQVDTVLIPYYSEAQRVLAVLDSIDEDEHPSSSAESGFQGLDYISFIANPVSWFQRKGVKRIILLGSEENSENAKFQYQFDRDDEGRPIINPFVSEKNDNKTIIWQLGYSAVMECPTIFWKIRFENLRPDPKLQKCINILYHELEKYLTKSKSLVDILSDKSLLSELKGSIQKECGNIHNRTSLVLLHGPSESNSFYNINWMKPRQWDIDKKGPRGSIYFPCGYNPCQSLLTGDLELPKDDCPISLVDDLINKHGGECLVFQFPHHGADFSYSNQFEKLNAVCAVISFGITNRFGHPTMTALDSLANNYPVGKGAEKRTPYVAFSNERHAVDYMIEVRP